MSILTNRELATLFWLLVGALIFRSVAKPFLGLVVACVTKPFTARTIVYMATFSGACVWVLHKIGVWELDNLKTTILWFIGVSLPWAVDFERLWRDPNEVARRAMIEAAGAAATISFVCNSFTFPLWGELLLVPVAAVLAFASSGKPRAESANVRDSNDRELLEASRDAFARASSLLLFKVFGESATEVMERLQHNRRPCTKLGFLTVTLWTDEWGPPSYELILAVTHRRHVDAVREVSPPGGRRRKRAHITAVGP